MRITAEQIKEKKWAFCLIFFILFFNPVFYFWAGDVSLKDKSMSWIICLVVGLAFSCLDLFLKKRGEKIYLSILFLLSLMPNLINWSYLYLSNLYMKRDMYWVIFNSNMSESTEYVNQFITWPIYLTITGYCGLGIFFILKAHSKSSLSIKAYPVLFVLPILIVLCDISLQYLSQAVPTLEFYKSYALFRKEYQTFEKEKELRMQLTTVVRCNLPDSTKHVFVVLLGESTTTCHMSLYGYFRETTPRMDARSSELDIYTDVITPDTHTYGVMQKVLTFANHKHPEYYKKKASLVELFNAAGFETYWIANNPILDKWGASYGVISQQAQHISDLSLAKKPDEIVLAQLKKNLKDGGKNNKIIFIHLMGNHHSYNSRYTKAFEHFNHKQTNDLADLDFRNKKMKQTIDEYDNSILYGDFVYDAILSELEKVNESAYLLFFSDHGEEVYETRDARGHIMSNVYPCQCQIPFVLWRSEKYKEENSDIIIDTTRPYSIEDVIYSLSTLSKLEYQDNDQSLSIFSADYADPGKRLVGDEDYEDVLKKVK
ncbi:phosphoethanolamine transferase CptA [Bacteroidia bacterium]|nr:phosphoethanolamine transferase CptA [Bacteroidia bacterium]